MCDDNKTKLYLNILTPNAQFLKFEAECLRLQTAHSQLLPVFGGEIELPLAIKAFLSLYGRREGKGLGQLITKLGKIFTRFYFKIY